MVRRLLDSKFQGYLLIVLLLVLWEAGVRTEGANGRFIPSVSAIGSSLLHLIVSFELIDHLVDSIKRISLGFLLGSTCGYLLGFVCGLSNPLYDLLEMTIEFLRPIPSVILIPIAMLFLGIGNALNVGVIAWACSWPVFVNTMDGVRSVDSTLLNTARMFGLSRWATIRTIYLPASLPQVISGLRIALGVAVAVGIISEMVVSTTGIGSFILSTSLAYRVPDMYAGIVTVGLLGYALNRVFLLLEWQTQKWNKGFSAFTN
jgi:NitT/TauT family transport system permease protein